MSSRKQAPRLARPAARYWKGKAPKGVVDVDTDSEAEDASDGQEAGDVAIGGEQDIVSDDDGDQDDTETRAESSKPNKSMNVSLRDVNISKDGKVIVAGREESGRTTIEETALEHDDSEDEESDEEQKPQVAGQGGAESDESSEYETDSDEDVKPKVQFRPLFVPKRGRVTIAPLEEAQDSEEAYKKKELEAEERRKQSHDMVAETIKRELAEKEKEEVIPDVDDTDGLDPTAEFEAWRLRELGRIKKEKEEELRLEEEREEIERRRALPEEQRLREDLERAQKLREEKPKGQQKFLQKYWHKGAFHQDEEILQRHDFTEATESTMDVSMMPKVMQVKNFGKRSRTKYTHLLDQDTTMSTGGFGGDSVAKSGKPPDGAGCFTCGGPHLKRDCPQNTGGPMGSNGFGSGSNAAPAGPRQWGAGRSGSWKDSEEPKDDGWKSRPPASDRRRDDDHLRHSSDRVYRRPNSPGPRNTSRRVSRSRSPLRARRRSRSREYDDRRRTSRSRSDSRERARDRSYRDKRRRLD